MAIAFIGLGSNLGSGPCNLRDAWHRLGEQPEIQLRTLSSPYRTAPVEMESEHWFTNAVGEVETGLAAELLLAVLLKIEQDMGRERTASRDRLIDLDLLFYGQLVQKSTRCQVPHPEISRRLFVLVPLAEIAPGFRHPETGKTAAEMIAALASSNQELAKTQWQGECYEST